MSHAAEKKLREKETTLSSADSQSSINEVEAEEQDDVVDPFSPGAQRLSDRFQKTTDAAASYGRNRRGSVSAESIKPSDNVADRIVIPKDNATKMRIAAATGHNLLFRNLEADQRHEIVDAMFERKVTKGDVIIKQGDEGDNFYVIDQGSFDVFVKKGDQEKKVITLTAGGSFGELALMYNTPRAATVIAAEDGVLWAVDRTTFRHSLTNHSFRKRRMYEDFLTSVNLLGSLEHSEIVKVADALEPVEYDDGDVIIQQGDPGDYFYVIESGECTVTKTDEQGVEHEFPGLKTGNYFGELALINDKPRAATVTAKGPVKVVALSRDAFVRLLGPVMDILKRNVSDYQTFIKTNSSETE